MSGVRKCPKCGGEMEKGRRLFSCGGNYLCVRKDEWIGRDKAIPWDSITAFFCRNCGYVELYTEITETTKP